MADDTPTVRHTYSHGFGTGDTGVTVAIEWRVGQGAGGETRRNMEREARKIVDDNVEQMRRFAVLLEAYHGE
jgi:hypothetical protein